MYAYFHYEKMQAYICSSVPSLNRELLKNSSNYENSTLSIFGTFKHGKRVNAKFCFLYSTLLVFDYVRVTRNEFVPENKAKANSKLNRLVLSVQPNHVILVGSVNPSPPSCSTHQSPLD